MSDHRCNWRTSDGVLLWLIIIAFIVLFVLVGSRLSRLEAAHALHHPECHELEEGK